MDNTENDDNVSVFRISDLLGSKKNNGDSLKKKTLISKKYNKNKDDIVMEVSSFKMSNKMTINGTGKKKKKTSLNKSDILWFHDEKLNDFRKMQDSLPKKRDLLKSTKLSASEKCKLRKEISRIESKVDETEYIDKTRNVIEKYKKASKKIENEVNDSIECNKDCDNIMKYVKKYDNVEKEELAEEYCRLTNNGMMINPKKLVFENNKCDQCGGDTKYIENFVTCMECGCISENSVYDYQICYKDLCDTMIKKNYEYKRPNRFKEILASLQAKENTDIPQFVINAVREEIKKDYSRDLLSIDVKKIKEYLKRLSLTSYYEHSPHILNSINGIPPVSIPVYIEDKLLEMFDSIQEPFEIVKEKVASNRLSFLSYNYCLYKFCELLELDEYKKHFTLLKSVEKLRVQDKIWRGICEMLDWDYIPSI
jgi:hypothetical protein